MRRIVLAGFAAIALALTGACAGDDANVDADLSADGADEGDSAQEYCEFSAELDTRQGVPSEEDFDRIVEVAPEEIKDDVETLVGEIQAGNQESEEAQAAAARLEAWEEDNCDRDAEGSGDEGDAGDGADAGDGGDGTGGDGTDTTDPDSTDADGDGSDGGGTGAEVEAEVGEDGETTTTH